MSFHEIDDSLWKSIEPYLPPQKPHTGRPHADMRKLKNFKIRRHVGRPVNRPSKMTADGMYDTSKIRKYNRRRGIKSNIPVNKRNRKKKKRGRPIKVDQEEYKKKSAIEILDVIITSLQLLCYQDKCTGFRVKAVHK